MKTILFHYLPDIFNAQARHGGSTPFIYLRDRLYELGYELKSSDNHPPEKAEWIFFLNSYIPDDNLKSKIKKIIKIILRREKGVRNLYRECLDKNIKNKILFLWESKSIAPYSYSQKVIDSFDCIFTWDDNLVDNKKFFKFYLPCLIRETVINKINFNHKKFLVNISMNKLSNSPNELYSMRRKSIKFFANKLGEQFDLFGYRWNLHKYKSYRGISENKIETLSGYKFSLCYENACGLNGYITEKIFDCFNAETVPIYWGAENITEYIDKEAFIDRRKFKSNQELLDFLKKIDENEYNKYLQAIEKFLASDKYKFFLPENFADTIINKLRLNNYAAS